MMHGRSRWISRWISVWTVTLAVILLAGAAPAWADTLFSDGFESGDFSAWSRVGVTGDGKATVQSATVKTGLAAQLSEGTTAGSTAFVRKTLVSPQQDLTATGDFRVLQQGANGGNVPFFTLLNPDGANVLSVYRLNNKSGSIRLRYGGSQFSTTGKIALSTWGTIAVHVIAVGSGSTVNVSLNGTQIYQTTSANLAGAGISTVQIGNDTAAQAFSLVADTISVQAPAPPLPSAPVNASPPAVSGTPQDGQTLTASTGNWTGTQPIAYGYQWRRCDTTGAACADIAGATGSTYPATTADVGSTLRVTVTATNSVGSASAVSAPTTTVQGAASPPVSTSPPTISGTPKDGSTLTAGSGTWSGTQPMSFAYQWERCDTSGLGCTAIAGAVNATYVASSADVGSTLRVFVTATNSAGSTSDMSDATTVVQASVSQAGLVALWPMDETSGTSMFDAIAGHTGSLHSVALGQPGFAGTAFGFSGTAYASVPSASDLNPGSSALTVTIHVKTTSVPASPDWDLIRKGLYTTAGGEYKMEYQPSGQASCGFKGSGGYAELTAGPAINDGQWHTVQCVKTATAIKVVVDGQAFAKTANIGTIANTDAVPIGARPGSEYFQGALDEASIQIG